MTNEEFQNLKEGDQLIRAYAGGNSSVGYVTSVLKRPIGFYILHENGRPDSIVRDCWNLFKKKEIRKSGFAKFIRSVEDRHNGASASIQRVEKE